MSGGFFDDGNEATTFYGDPAYMPDERQLIDAPHNKTLLSSYLAVFQGANDESDDLSGLPIASYSQVLQLVDSNNDTAQHVPAPMASSSRTFEGLAATAAPVVDIKSCLKPLAPSPSLKSSFKSTASPFKLSSAATEFVPSGVYEPRADTAPTQEELEHEAMQKWEEMQAEADGAGNEAGISDQQLLEVEAMIAWEHMQTANDGGDVTLTKSELEELALLEALDEEIWLERDAESDANAGSSYAARLKQSAGPAPSKSRHAGFVEAVASTVPVCDFFLQGICRYGESCRFVHERRMKRCSGCGASHVDTPTGLMAHLQECTDEENQQHAREVEASASLTCGICLESPVALQRKFGLLVSCTHAFCLPCIRSWRSQESGAMGSFPAAGPVRASAQSGPTLLASGFGPPRPISSVANNDGRSSRVNSRTCPLCKVESYFVLPCDRMVVDQDRKQRMVDEYKQQLSRVPCMYTARGGANAQDSAGCPFGSSCFYAHDAHQRSMEQVVLRHRTDADGNVELIRGSTIADFLGF